MISTVALGELQPAKKQSLDPRKSPAEQFELLSIPAFDAGAPEVVLGAEVGSSKQLVNPGDVMISKIVPHIRRAWVVPEARDGRQIASSEWIVHRSDRFDSRYLRHVLLSDRFHQSFMQTVAGVGGSLLRARPAYVAEIEIPLPPIEEQRRIAAILDAADALRAKRRLALAKLDTLTQAIFIDMFGDPAFNPSNFPSQDLVDVADGLDGVKCGPFGTQLAQHEYTDTGVPLWGIPQVNKGFKVETHEFLTPQKAEELNSYSIQPGDIVMTRKGTIGNCAVYPNGKPAGVMHSDLLRIRCNSDTNPRFLSDQLTFSREIGEQIRVMSGGAVMPGINVTKLKNITVLNPPSELQSEYANRCDSVDKALQAAGHTLSESNDLFASLQQRAFRGDL